MSSMSATNKHFNKSMKKAFLFSLFGSLAMFKNAATADEDKSKLTAKLDGAVSFEVNTTSKLNFGIKTSSYFGSKVRGLLFDAGLESTFGFNLNFGGSESEDKSKMVSFDSKFSILKGSYVLGFSNSSVLVNDNVKKNFDTFLYLFDNYMSVDEIIAAWKGMVFGGEHKIDVKVGYVSDAYSNNEENKVVAITTTYTHLGIIVNNYELKDITAAFALVFMSDSGLFVIKMNKKINDSEDFDEYRFIGPIFSNGNNILGAGANFFLPSFNIGSGFKSRYADVNLKVSLSPFHTLFYDGAAADYMRWGVMVSASGKIVDEKASNATLDVSVGRDEWLSYWFIDEFVDLFKNYDDCVGISTEGKSYYLLPRPLLFNFKATGKYDFVPLIKDKADYIKELSLSLSVKYETIFDIKIQNYTGKVSNLKFLKDGKESSFTDMFYVNVALTPSITFEDEISDSKLSFLRGSKFTVLGTELTLKPMLDASSNKKCADDDTEEFDNTRSVGCLPSINYKGFSIDINVTLGNIEYKIEKYGLDFKLKLVTLKFNKADEFKFDWHVLVDFGMTFDIFKCINNR